MPHVRTLILGGGMSGLSCAYHLNQMGDKDYLLLERSDEPGGLSRSIKQDGFVFDHTGHLLHFHKPGTRELIQDKLGVDLVEKQRSAWIYSHNKYTRYPFQANLYGLPPKVIKECLDGLKKAQLTGRRVTDRLVKNDEQQKDSEVEAAQNLLTQDRRKERNPVTPDRRIAQTFKNWVLYTFGEGFGKHFFFPYNKKLWTVEPEELTTEWMGQFVPRPTLEEVEKGAWEDQTKEFGYNATFFYPREGGIQTLAFAFARNLPSIQLNTTANSVDLDKKIVALSTGETVSYDYLVNTIPLVHFLNMATPLPDEISFARKQLRWSSVYDINLGVKRADISENKKHWIYFPETEYCFYRVGFPMNFSDKVTPPGCSSMYVEVGYSPDKPFDEGQAYREAIDGLITCGLLRDESEIVTRNIIKIPIAYVTYDQNWRTSTTKLRQFLRDRKVYSISRFGDWKYSYMEAAILEGKATAEKILGESVRAEIV